MLGLSINGRSFRVTAFTEGKASNYAYEDYNLMASIYFYKGRWRYSVSKKGRFAYEPKDLPEQKRRLESDCWKLVEQLNCNNAK